jgi:flagellar protein FlaG
MNEVRFTPVATTVVTRSASSKGGDVDGPVQPIGKILPPATAGQAVPNAETKVVAGSSEQVQNAVVSINQFVQSLNRDLHFSVDEETERTVIKVIDSSSGKLIRQIPEEVVLELARKLNDDGGFQLIDALG